MRIRENTCSTQCVYGGDAKAMLYKSILCTVTATHTYTHRSTCTHSNKRECYLCTKKRLQVEGCQGLLEVYKLHPSHTSVLSQWSAATLHIILYVHLVCHVGVCVQQILRLRRAVCLSGHFTAGSVRKQGSTVRREMSRLPPPQTMPPYISKRHSTFMPMTNIWRYHRHMQEYYNIARFHICMYVLLYCTPSTLLQKRIVTGGSEQCVLFCVCWICKEIFQIAFKHKTKSFRALKT